MFVGGVAGLKTPLSDVDASIPGAVEYPVGNVT
jgi:hypothetical protein